VPHFEPLVVSFSTTSALRKQLFFQIPTQTLSNAIALPGIVVSEFPSLFQSKDEPEGSEG
jgi:hypothetical protein